MKKIKHTAMVAAILSMACNLQAQVNMQNTGVLFLSGNNDTLYINGAFTNASGAALTNNGHLQVKQNLINGQASMAIGTGTLYLNGSSLQAVSGAQMFRTFHFVSNNTGGIVLNNDLSVSGTHTFVAGIISSSATPNYLIYEAGSSYSGDGDSRHVSGWVRKTGNTNFIFPVGNGTVERTIGLSNISAASTFNTRYAGATTNTSNIASPLNSVDPNEYWIINRVSGGNAQVAMNWDNTKVAFPLYVLSDIRVVNYTAGNWTSVGGSASGSVASTGTITSNSIGSFGSFTFGSISALLPVQLLDLSAKRLNGHNLISWTTSNEINVKNYEVQRSDDGSNFYTAGVVAARNSAQVQQYQFADTKSMKDVAYYRLRSMDLDGKSKTSKVIAVYDRTVPGNSFTITNPVHGAVTFAAGTNHNGLYQYKITTVSGQVLQQGRINLNSGGNYSIPLLSNVVNGIYVFDINGNGFNVNKTILVQ